MKIILWNVNGLRAISNKEITPGISFTNYIKQHDIIVLDETKISEEQTQDHMIPNGFMLIIHNLQPNVDILVLVCFPNILQSKGFDRLSRMRKGGWKFLNLNIFS